MYYAGIGSRQTPNDVLYLIQNIALNLSVAGYTLRSGGADGADLAFESGASNKEIFYHGKDLTTTLLRYLNLYHSDMKLLRRFIFSGRVLQNL